MEDDFACRGGDAATSRRSLLRTKAAVVLVRFGEGGSAPSASSVSAPELGTVVDRVRALKGDVADFFGLNILVFRSE